MPTPKPRETEDAYVKRCIPIVLHEGTAKDGAQAEAICHSMYERHKRKKKSMSVGYLKSLESK